MSLAAPSIAAAVSSSAAQKQHPSSHVGHHGSMTSQQSSFYGQMANHHHQNQVMSGGQNRAPASAGCLAKLQQLTNGLESGAPTSSANQVPSSNQSNSVATNSSNSRSVSSKQAARNAAAVADQAAQAARNTLIPSGYAYPTAHQAPSGPTPPPPSHTPGVSNAGPVPSSYYGRSDMSRGSATGHTAPTAPSISANHLMHQYGQNAAHHHMLNYTGYGYLNQFMYHAAAASDHQRTSAATPQPGGHGAPPPHPQHMYPGYPHLGYPTNYHR